MTVQIALLRGINVGGRRLVAMADLRQLLTELGFTEVQSLLQSGNLVFEGGAEKGAALERSLEQAAVKRLALECDFLVRTARQWSAVVAANPFPDEAKRDPQRLVVLFLKAKPAAAAWEALRLAMKGMPEVLHPAGQEAYLYYPGGMGTSRLTGALLERKLGTRGTARNWNTVLKLAALASA